MMMKAYLDSEGAHHCVHGCVFSQRGIAHLPWRPTGEFRAQTHIGLIGLGFSIVVCFVRQCIRISTGVGLQVADDLAILRPGAIPAFLASQVLFLRQAIEVRLPRRRPLLYQDSLPPPVRGHSLPYPPPFALLLVLRFLEKK